MWSKPLVRVVAISSLAFALSGCAVYRWVGLRVVYDVHSFPERLVHRDLSYGEGAAADDTAHRLDLYRPEGEGWPTMLFVHGGGWTNGDKGLRVSAVDVYGNIGRFYAAHGIGVAVVNYRLQPTVEWPEQVADVRLALDWLSRHVAEYGGNETIFLAGHSAGAHLASHVALAPSLDVARTRLCGVIAVSGAGYDLEDEETYELGAEPDYYEERLRTGPGDENWRRESSVIPLVTEKAVPFLILYAEGEWQALHRQSQVLAAALDEAGVPLLLIEVPGENHERMVLALSHPDRTAGPAVLEFIHRSDCGG